MPETGSLLLVMHLGSLGGENDDDEAATEVRFVLLLLWLGSAASLATLIVICTSSAASEDESIRRYVYTRIIVYNTGVIDRVRMHRMMDQIALTHGVYMQWRR